MNVVFEERYRYMLEEKIEETFPGVKVVGIRKTKYMVFVKMKSNKKKTYDVLVCNLNSGDPLCLIAWHGAWRQYTMKSVKCEINQITFNRDCLKDIIEYIDELMNERIN